MLDENSTFDIETFDTDGEIGIIGGADEPTERFIVQSLAENSEETTEMTTAENAPKNAKEMSVADAGITAVFGYAVVFAGLVVLMIVLYCTGAIFKSKDAKANAKRNNIKNMRFIAADATEYMTQMSQNGERADVIVMDPPRSGSTEAFVRAAASLKPSRIVYVSCEPETLGRDLAWFRREGYHAREAWPVDMFAFTECVETVVKLSLKKDTPKIEVTMEPSAESNYTPVEKATYGKIKAYVKEKYGVNVHTRYIAEVKRMCGLDMGENYNKSKKENPEVKHCPQDKVEYIKDALRYFKVIVEGEI